jgi:hypothetical protein
MFGLRGLLPAIALGAMAVLFGFPAAAEPSYQGPGKCGDCHKGANAVWAKSAHGQSFKDLHKKPTVRAIIKAAGGTTNIRRNDVCTDCHFTMIAPKPGAKPVSQMGTSCESCHGPSSDWLPIHNATGDKAARNAKAIAAGMIMPHMLYDIAKNCLTCHGATRDGVDPETFAKMVDAGHAPATEFELVRYSQGSVRHRFYPPNVNQNKEMTPAELSRTFITGHAAALVMTSSIEGKSKNAKYEETIKKMDTSARAAIEAIKGQVPEAAAFLATPNDDNARKLVAAIADKDLTPQVGKMLPAKNTYK